MTSDPTGPPEPPAPEPPAPDPPAPERVLPPGVVAPQGLDLPTGHHLRRIRPDDLALDLVAVRSSQPRLWARFGPIWGWPPADLTDAQDHADLVRHAREMDANVSFNFAIFDAAETALLGCVYVDPPVAPGSDAEVVWWVVDAEVGGALDRCLDDAIPRWLARDWPLHAPRIVGCDLSIAAWHAEVDGPDAG